MQLLLDFQQHRPILGILVQSFSEELDQIYAALVSKLLKRVICKGGYYARRTRIGESITRSYKEVKSKKDVFDVTHL